MNATLATRRVRAGPGAQVPRSMTVGRPLIVDGPNLGSVDHKPESPTPDKHVSKSKPDTGNSKSSRSDGVGSTIGEVYNPPPIEAKDEDDKDTNDSYETKSRLMHVEPNGQPKAAHTVSESCGVTKGDSPFIRVERRSYFEVVYCKLPTVSPSSQDSTGDRTLDILLAAQSVGNSAVKASSGSHFVVGAEGYTGLPLKMSKALVTQSNPAPPVSAPTRHLNPWGAPGAADYTNGRDW